MLTIMMVVMMTMMMLEGGGGVKARKTRQTETVLQVHLIAASVATP